MIVKLDNVSKEYKNETVLKNISVSLESGKVYGLWGKNGSGKTMFMRAISGLIKPTTGKVYVDGEELCSSNPFPGSIGILIENPGFLDSFSGYANLKMLADIKGIIGKEEINLVLQTVGLYEQKGKKYRKYSLGMKKKLGIAAAIMEKPDIVLLDEPMNALDKESAEKVRSIIKNLKEDGCLVVLAAHDMDDINELSDVIIKMESGEIVE